MLRRGRRSGGERRKNTPERSVKPPRIVHTADHQRAENTSSKSAIKSAQLTCLHPVQEGSGTLQADEVRALRARVRRICIVRVALFCYTSVDNKTRKILLSFSLKAAVTQHKQTVFEKATSLSQDTGRNDARNALQPLLHHRLSPGVQRRRFAEVLSLLLSLTGDTMSLADVR